MAAYVIRITGAAAEASAAVAEYREEVGERVRFESRADAEALVERLNGEADGDDAAVRLRSVHEENPLEEGQDPVDGYVEPA